MIPPFTKQELADYIKRRGYTADIDDMYDYFVQTEFCFVQGRLRIPLANWKNNVNVKLRNGKFKAKKISGNLKKKITEQEAKHKVGL